MEETENTSTNIVEQIENDDFFKYFLESKSALPEALSISTQVKKLDEDFFKYSLESKSALPEALSISAQVKKLGEGIDLISRELQKHVLEKYEDLLRQGNHAAKLEDILLIMNEHVQNLFANAERLRNQINGPYNALETHTRVLSRLHLASHILRQVNRIQQLSKRLGNTTDPIQKATILYELEQLTSDDELKDIEVVTVELRNIREQQQKVIKLANGSLNQGIKNENISQTTTAIQIFINLGTIDSIIKNFIEMSLSECRESLKVAFNINLSNLNSGKNRGKISLSSSQGFRAKIWVEVEKSFSEEIFQQCKQIKFLQKVVDDMNYQNVETNIAVKFWEDLGRIIQEEIKNSSGAVQQMLEEDYPKLLHCFNDMFEKLKYDKFHFNRQIFEKCENSYLSTSLNRLLEPTQAMFGLESEIPTHDQIDSIIRIISSELSVALVEEHLIEKVCKNVTKCVKMFAVKTEQQLETGPESAQVIGGSANSGQQRNVQYANSLYYFKIQIQRILINMKESLPEIGTNIVNESLEVLSNLIGVIMQPLVTSINTTVETIIVTIHLETDWNRLQIPPGKTTISCSPYMKELSQFLSRVYNIYLANFDDKEILLSKCSEIAIRCIELLVRHSALLRPISKGGRLRLHADFVQLENVLKMICPHLTNLGRPYRLLKSMASLVTLTPEEIVASQASESSVPHSIVLLLLFSFAESDLASPHQNTGWSLPKLSVWLDEHPSESERLDLIAGALQRYETLIRQRNSTNYDKVYPLMSQFLATAIKMKI